MIVDPRIEYTKLINDSSKFYSGLVMAITAGCTALYFNHPRDLQQLLYLILAFIAFLNLLICVSWQRKIQIWIVQRNAIAFFQKESGNKENKHFYEFEEAYLKSQQATLQLKYLPSTDSFDLMLPEAFKMIYKLLSIGFMAYFILSCLLESYSGFVK